MSTLELLSEHACFGGVQRFYRHASGAIGLPMQFGVFLPPQALHGGHKVPVLFYLAGLTCNEETFAIKAGAQQHAARLGLAIVTPDTSPSALMFFRHPTIPFYVFVGLIRKGLNKCFENTGRTFAFLGPVARKPWLHLRCGNVEDDHEIALNKVFGFRRKLGWILVNDPIHSKILGGVGVAECTLSNHSNDLILYLEGFTQSGRSKRRLLWLLLAAARINHTDSDPNRYNN